MEPKTLLARLQAIGERLSARADALGLLGLGSVGRERDRLDAHSDLDFFVIVRPGAKSGYLASLDWLAVRPLVWHFQNTADGHKALMDDGVFCEFAIFEPAELEAIPYAPGAWVWRRDELDERLALPRRSAPAAGAIDVDWQVNEALSNLIIGLHRLARGERLAAMRMIQVFALDRLLMLADCAPGTDGVTRDPFAPERRIEQRHPALAAALPALAPGYGQTAAAARALLAWLQQHHRVPAAVAAEIARLADVAEQLTH